MRGCETCEGAIQVVCPPDRLSQDWHGRFFTRGMRGRCEGDAALHLAPLGLGLG